MQLTLLVIAKLDLSDWSVRFALIPQLDVEVVTARNLVVVDGIETSPAHGIGDFSEWLGFGIIAVGIQSDSTCRRALPQIAYLGVAFGRGV